MTELLSNPAFALGVLVAFGIIIVAYIMGRLAAQDEIAEQKRRGQL